MSFIKNIHLISNKLESFGSVFSGKITPGEANRKQSNLLERYLRT